MSTTTKRACVLGAGGFIGNHLVTRLSREGFWVRGVDLKHPEFRATEASDFIVGDLRDPQVCAGALDQPFDEVYQLAADMGGAGYIFTGDNDAHIMHNSALVNLNVLECARAANVKRIFYSSSACIYPEYNQLDADAPETSEASAYPADPDSEYGWEKLFSERLYLSYQRNFGLNVRIARYHNIFGPEGVWTGGREKVPAALCRKVAETLDGGEIEMWGDGKQTRSFLYIDECLEGTNALAEMVMQVAGKHLTIRHIDGPQGVRGRNSDNRLILDKLGWAPEQALRDGIAKTYPWIRDQVERARVSASAA
ncbi:MAG: NAD-dependent dehydratase [Rhodospirillales bacterium]|nr:NAD-dependent dehydratase [Rhodospirillales bacterium]